jgi:nucleoside-diphosphate-sugar epimerase
VGAPLLQRLLADGQEVHALTTGPRELTDEKGIHWHGGNLLDPYGIAPVVDEVRPEQLVHLAWDVSHGRFWTALENAEWVEASLRLVRAFAHTGGRRAVLVGSCAEYAWGGDQELDERNSEINPDSLYGICKDALHRIASAYADEAGLELAWGRLFFLYGPREQPERFVPAVIRSLISGVRVATTAGTQVRDFMHVQDAAGALGAVLQSDLTGPVNIGSGQGTSIAEVLDILGAVTSAGDLIDRGARPALGSEPARIVADVGRLAGEVGYRPAISLRDGLAASVDWWRERQGTPSAGLSPTGS